MNIMHIILINYLHSCLLLLPPRSTSLPSLHNFYNCPISLLTRTELELVLWPHVRQLWHLVSVWDTCDLEIREHGDGGHREVVGQERVEVRQAALLA